MHKSSGAIATNNSSCSNYIGNYSISGYAVIKSSGCGQSGAIPLSVYQQDPCGVTVWAVDANCGNTYEYHLTITAPPNYTMSRVDWWLNGGSPGGTGSGNSYTAVFTTQGDNDINFTPYFQYICKTPQVLFSMSDDPPPNNTWTNAVGSYTSVNGSSDYLKVLVKDSAGNILNQSDTGNRIRLLVNGVVQTGNQFDDLDVPQQWPYILGPGTYTLQARYLGSTNQYWCSATSGKITMTVPACTPPSPPVISPSGAVAAGTQPITWPASSGTPPISYDLVVLDNGNPLLNVSNTTSGANSVNFQFGHTYTITVTARNSCPPGSGSSTVTVTVTQPGQCSNLTINSPTPPVGSPPLAVNTTVTGSGSFSQCQVDFANGAGSLITQSVPCNNLSYTYPAGAPSQSYTLVAKVFDTTSNTWVGDNGSGNCSKTVQISPPPSYFQGFGGGVVAANWDLASGSLKNGTIALAVPSQYTSMNDGSNNFAGIVVGKTFNPTSNYSAQPGGGSQGWNLGGYTFNLALTAKVSYQTLLSNLLQNIGIGSQQASMDNFCQNNPASGILSNKVDYYCYNGPGGLLYALNNPLTTGQGHLQFLYPSPQGQVGSSLSQTPLTITNNNVIVFVNGDLSLGSPGNAVSINVQPNGSSSLVFVILAGLTTYPPSSGSQLLDGLYVFSGPFDDCPKGNNCTITPLVGRGSLLATGVSSSPNFGRYINNASGESFYFEGKYLDSYKNLLSVPKVSWGELPPK